MIAVAVADRPEGPFRDALGKPLIAPGEGYFDPTVWVDGDGQTYLYWGNPDLWYVKLNRDIMSYSGPITKVQARQTDYQEGPWFYGRHGRYYMAFASTCCSEGIGYAMSDNPTGPWTYKGPIMEHDTRASGNHPGIIDYKGGSYVFGFNYELNFALTPVHRERRSVAVAVAKFSYNADGTIPNLGWWERPVPQIETLAPYQRVETETIAWTSRIRRAIDRPYAWTTGVTTAQDGHTGVYVTRITDGSYIKVSGVDFGAAGAKSFVASVANGMPGSTIELHADRVDEQLLGTAQVGAAGGGRWRDATAAIARATGVRNLYLVFRGVRTVRLRLLALCRLIEGRRRGDRVMRLMKFMASGCAALMIIAAAPPTPSQPLDETSLATRFFGADATWYRGNIPFFETSDPQLQQVYYYRWQVFRAHQRDLGQRGYITTEFLDDVSWQREPYASLNDATGFHIDEGRWLRDRRYTGDYIDFMYYGGGNDRHFSEAIAASVWGRYLVDHDRTSALSHLDTMRHVYGLWDDRFDFTKGLYWIEPLLDATEYTISSIDASGGTDGFTGGPAFRPSINSYMFANARAISRLAALNGDAATAADYAARADALRTRVEQALWNPGYGHFVDRYKISNEYVHYWDAIRGRELVGYLPWTFGLADDTPERARAWRHLLSAAELGGPAGMRTVEPSYPNYMRQYRYDKDTKGRECQWNGPVWPFQTTQVLTGMANLLHDYHQSEVKRSDYLRLLRQYARLHYQDGRLDLEEDYDPATGKPIVGLPRSHHYNHSGYVDLIVGGMVGLRPRADDVLEVDPLVPTDPADPGFQRWFTLQDVPYHGRLVTVTFDAEGRHYRHGRGLFLYVDGAQVAHAPTLGRLTAPIAPRPNAPLARPIDLAVNLVRGEFPKPSASVNTDSETLHDAVDGRVWFFPEMANGWSTQGGGGAAWFAVDLGRLRMVQAAELAFFADGKRFAAPARYQLQAWRAGRWTDIAGASAGPAVANGVTRVTWPATATDKIRLLLNDAPGRATRLVEMKLF